MRSTPRADCITRCRPERRGSACTTIRRSRSRGCSDQGVERVAYVDVDVHHGDGPQAIFYDDPRVLTISIHEFAPHVGFFPGTGGPGETGGAAAPGSAINVPLDPGTGDDGWLEAFLEVVPPAVKAFQPDVLVTQLGCDTHASDPLGPPAPDHQHLPSDRADAARARARRRRRTLGRDGWRRLSVGARGATRLDHRTSRRWRTSSCPTGCPQAGSNERRPCRVRRFPRRCRTPIDRGGSFMIARTKLVCTLGPPPTRRRSSEVWSRRARRSSASTSRTALPDEHERAARLVREAEADAGRALAVLADLPGPKVRLGTMDPDPFRFVPGQTFDLRPAGDGDEGGASTTYPGLADDLRRRRSRAAGRRRRRAGGDEPRWRSRCIMQCVRGGIVRSGQGVNVPAERLSLPAVTDARS